MCNIKRLVVGTLTFFMLYSHAFAEDLPETQNTVPTGVLVGQFKKNGKAPLTNGRLFVYNKAMGLPSADRYVRVPDQLAELDKDGKFQLQLPAGTYYLSAVKAPDEMVMGPPPDGEMIYFKMNGKKEIQPFIVRVGKKTNAGIISSSLPYKRSNNRNVDSGATLIEGVVVDEKGAPVEGAVILAHLKPGIQEMASYVSERTAKDGKFSLRVSEGGTYYLRVRSEYHGGTPTAGEYVNSSDPKDQVAVTVNKRAKLAGVTIIVKRQAEKGPLGREK